MKITNKEILEIIKLYENGMSSIELGKKFNCNSLTILNYLRKNEIKTRKYTYNNKIRKRKVDLNYFKIIDSPKKAYIIGLFIADGSVDKSGYGFQLTSKDYSQVSLFKKALKSEHKICEVNNFDKRTNKTYKRYNIHICSKQMTQDLMNLGIFNNKSFDCEMPKIDKKYFWHFLRGLIDGDGWIIDNGDGRVKVGIIATENITNYIKSYLESFGFSKIKSQVVSEKNGKRILSTKYNSYDNISFLKDKLYENCGEYRLKRKFNIIKNVKKHKSNPAKYKKWKKIKVTNEMGNITIYNNIKICKENMKIEKSEYIYRVLRGERKTHKNCTFEYFKE